MEKSKEEKSKEKTAFVRSMCDFVNGRSLTDDMFKKIISWSDSGRYKHKHDAEIVEYLKKDPKTVEDALGLYVDIHVKRETMKKIFNRITHTKFPTFEEFVDLIKFLDVKLGNDEDESGHLPKCFDNFYWTRRWLDDNKKSDLILELFRLKGVVDCDCELLQQVVSNIGSFSFDLGFDFDLGDDLPDAFEMALSVVEE